MSKTYKVIGTQPIRDHHPGETFTEDIPEDQEAFLIQIGGLKVLANEVKETRAGTTSTTSWPEWKGK